VQNGTGWEKQSTGGGSSSGGMAAAQNGGELKNKKNQLEVAVAVVHGDSAKWKWLKTRKKG